MDKANEDFTIPFYIVEETAQDKCKCMKLKNTKTLLRLAQINNKLTDTQVKYIMNTYRIE